jgi:hypothetical protein
MLPKQAVEGFAIYLGSFGRSRYVSSMTIEYAPQVRCLEATQVLPLGFEERHP